MGMLTARDTKLTAECWCLAHDFTRELVEEWKSWLAGSAPMAAIAVLSLIDPERVRLPLWSWAIVIFVAGLVVAMFRVYRDLRRQRDAFRDQIAGVGVAGPFLLVPFHGDWDRGPAPAVGSERIHDL